MCQVICELSGTEERGEKNVVRERESSFVLFIKPCRTFRYRIDKKHVTYSACEGSSTTDFS